MQRKWLYLSLTILGAVAPMIAFVPWLAVHGLDVRLFLTQLFANRISTFFAIDLLITGCIVAVFVQVEKKRAQPAFLVMLTLLCVGVSAALPLLLFLRERAHTKTDTA